MNFDTVTLAELALRRNGFERLADYPGPWESSIPPHDFYDARPDEPGIYSKQGYWIK